MNDHKQFSIQTLRAERREAGQRMNPDDAVLYCRYAMEADPYGVCDDIPQEFQCIGKNWFAFTPETGEVVVQDLPEEIWKRINDRYASERQTKDQFIALSPGEDPFEVDL